MEMESVFEAVESLTVVDELLQPWVQVCQSNSQKINAPAGVIFRKINVDGFVFQH